MKSIKKIKVLVVDDSIFFRDMIVKGLSKDPGIDVVGTAGDVFEARDKIIDFEPDVITLDVEMPKMNGIDFLKKLMPQYPLPVVVVSSVSDKVFEALNAGAVDFVAKTNLFQGVSGESFINELIVKIKISSLAKINQLRKNNVSEIKSENLIYKDNVSIIAIGASTGGTEAILKVVKDFSIDMPCIVVTQHMPPVFTKMYADRLNKLCKMEVKEAKNGDSVTSGKIFIAPGDKHMQVIKKYNNYIIECFSGEKVNGHCPSVDVLFNSVAENVGANSIGILLTGMGCDGAKGLLNMKQKGAFTIGQDEQSSIVYGMPKVAYNIGAVSKQMSLNNIPQMLYSLFNSK